MAGQMNAIVALPAAVPPPGEVRWPDGTSTSMALLSADQTFARVTPSAPVCDGCRRLRITGARLVRGVIETSRGLASVPLWQFDVEGSAVKGTRIAVADIVSVIPPPWDPNRAPLGISIDAARQGSDASMQTVSFVGAPEGGDRPCGSDYSAGAVESPLAVVVLIIEHPNPAPGGCALVGAVRTAAVQLAAPLADRIVLEVKPGLPVAVTR
jgi:hypothetical protein